MTYANIQAMLKLRLDGQQMRVRCNAYCIFAVFGLIGLAMDSLVWRA